MFMDDLIIHSKSFEEHLFHLKDVFERFKKAKLKLNTKKCKFFQKSIKFLGHIITYNQVAMDPDKIKAIIEIATPTTVISVQHFIGAVGYYRIFIKDFAKIAAPLHKLTRKEIKFVWTQECEEAFNKMKQLVSTYPVLRLPDFNKEFFLSTDASGLAIGAILQQKTEDNKEYAIQFISRLLKGAEIHYTITEKECLAIIWGILKLSVYLCSKKFTIITDHSALIWLLSTKNATGRIARWQIILQTFEFEIIHESGKKHLNVDALTRLPLKTTTVNMNIVEFESNNENEPSSKGLDPYEDSILIDYLKNRKFNGGLSKKQIKRVTKESDKYFMEDGIIWLKTNESRKERQVPPIEQRKAIVKKIHLISHTYARATYDRLKQSYYWRKMFDDVQKVKENCLQCLKNNSAPIERHPALALQVNNLFDNISIDCVFGLPEVDEYHGLLIIIEQLSGFPEVYPIKSKDCTEIAKRYREWICLFGAAKQILSDQGKEFLKEVINKLNNLLGTEHRVTSSYMPSTNGRTKKFNFTFVNTLRKFTEDDQYTWIGWIPFILLAYRSRIHSITYKITI